MHKFLIFCVLVTDIAYIVSCRQLLQNSAIKFGGGKSVKVDANNSYLLVQGEDDDVARAAQFAPLFVIGSDDRVPVPSTITEPWKSFGQVGNFCSGTVIGPRHVLTAAHCVYSLKRQELMKGISFTPGRDGKQAPFGEYNYTIAFFPDEFKTSKDRTVIRSHDYAVIILDRLLDPQVPLIRWQNSCTNPQKQYSLNIAGYPSDKVQGLMYTTGCTGVKFDCGQVLFEHLCDTFGGMSGSSMFIAFRLRGGGVGFRIKAIHSAGTIADGSLVNAGVVITETIEKQIKQWVDQYP